MRYIIIFLVSVGQCFSMSWNNAEGIYKRLGGGPPLTYNSTSIVNAINTGDKIILTRGLLRTANTNEMAFTLGHELGHSVSGEMLGWNAEFNADRYGVMLANSKGFNACSGARSILTKINEPASASHPSTAERIRRLPC